MLVWDKHPTMRAWHERQQMELKLNNKMWFIHVLLLCHCSLYVSFSPYPSSPSERYQSRDMGSDVLSRAAAGTDAAEHILHNPSSPLCHYSLPSRTHWDIHRYCLDAPPRGLLSAARCVVSVLSPGWKPLSDDLQHLQHHRQILGFVFSRQRHGIRIKILLIVVCNLVFSTAPKECWVTGNRLI